MMEKLKHQRKLDFVLRLEIFTYVFDKNDHYY